MKGKGNVAKVKTLKGLRRIVFGYYARNKRDLPWRRTTNPYHILVSEVMLQQTQVSRVEGKYVEFIKIFPNVAALANAKLSFVLKVWQGLGYNRRAKYLYEAAKCIAEEHNGIVPETIEELDALPGIGRDTAAAILAYAHDRRVIFLETNIRTVFIHHFFPKRRVVSDTELLPLVEAALPLKNFRQWHSALMDYGAYLKRMTGNISRKSRTYAKQSKFDGSLRQVRGAIMRALTNRQAGYQKTTLFRAIDVPTERDRFNSALTSLYADGLVKKQGSRIVLP